MEMTWDNYVLFLASIPGDDDSEGVGSAGSDAKPEVKNVWELF